MKRFLDWLLGPRCQYCPCRVFPADAVKHYRAHGAYPPPELIP